MNDERAMNERGSAVCQVKGVKGIKAERGRENQQRSEFLESHKGGMNRSIELIVAQDAFFRVRVGV